MLYAQLSMSTCFILIPESAGFNFGKLVSLSFVSLCWYFESIGQGQSSFGNALVMYK